MYFVIHFDNLHNFEVNYREMLARTIEPIIHKLAKGFPIIAITGPRQAGKTTLAKRCFPQKPYVTLENPDILELALSDPKGFLNHYRPIGVILDEVQRAPQLFSYLQGIVDDDKQMGAYILTGSQQFGLLSAITQSLAGRVGLIELLPFSFNEIKNTPSAPLMPDTWIVKGGYPPLYDRELDPDDWFASYVSTYIERDIRSIKKVHDLRLFQQFIKMCATRTGQLLNLTSLANDCGITHNTAQSWLSILETSYILFFLQPYYANLGKRLTKSPKLYFYDTGLASWLLGIKSSDALFGHAFRGALFENMVIADGMKHYLNAGKNPSFSFFRDSNGMEVDLIIEKGQDIEAVEIKSGATLNTDYFKHLNTFSRVAKNVSKKTLIYTGETELATNGCQVFNWANDDLFS